MTTPIQTGGCQCGALRFRIADQDAVSFLAGLVSYQHPDHDTAEWPPGERG